LELKCEKCLAGETIKGEKKEDLQILNAEKLEIFPLKLYTLNKGTYKSPEK